MRHCAAIFISQIQDSQSLRFVVNHLTRAYKNPGTSVTLAQYILNKKTSSLAPCLCVVLSITKAAPALHRVFFKDLVDICYILNRDFYFAPSKVFSRALTIPKRSQSPLAVPASMHSMRGTHDEPGRGITWKRNHMRS